MKDWLRQWINSWSWSGLLATVLIFIVTFAVSLAIVSFILVRLPPDYFQESSERNFLQGYPKWVRLAAVFGKNLLGLILVVVGIILSIPGVPGQGLLTILLGIMLLDFPGKRRLEHRIVSRPKVRDAINGLRQKFGKEPMQLE
jgi:hypothetical protein